MPEAAVAPPVVVGRISGLYGVQGWLRVYSYTDPRDNILRYPTWLLRQGGEVRVMRLREGRAHGKGVVASLVGCEEREQARALIGAEVSVSRQDLPEPGPDEVYWVDLIGLEVVTRRGEHLGRVARVHATGGNDVLEVQGDRERLIPYLRGSVVLRVDLQEGRVLVDWDASY